MLPLHFQHDPARFERTCARCGKRDSGRTWSTTTEARTRHQRQVGSSASTLIVEASGTAGFLLPNLVAAGVPVESVTRRFYVEACAALDAAVAARKVRHGDGPALNAAVAAARWLTSGEAGQRVLSRKDPRVSGLVAAALALHALSLPKPSAGGWVMAV